MLEKLSVNIAFLVVGIIIGGIVTAISGYYAQCRFKEYEVREINKPILIFGRRIGVHRNQGESKLFIDYAVRNEGINAALEYQVYIDGAMQEKQMLLIGHEFKEFSFYGDINNNPFLVRIEYKDIFGNKYETKQNVFLSDLNNTPAFQRYEQIVLAKRK